jgi:PAS domain S-box-containing protein
MLRLNISQKFVGYLVLLSILPLLAVGLTAYTTASDTLLDASSRYSFELVRNQRDYIDLQMEQIESLIGNIAGVQEIRDVLDDMNTSDDTYTDLTTQARIGYILNSYAELRGLVSIDIFTTRGAHFHVGDTLNTDDIRDVLRDELFVTALYNNNNITWLGIQENVNVNSNYQQVATAAKVFYNLNRETLEQEAVALLLVNYDVNALASHLEQTNLGEDASIIVLDSKGDMIYHPDMQQRGQPLPAVLTERLATMQTSGNVRLNDRDFLFNFVRSDIADWTIIGLIPLETLNAQALPIQRTMSLALLGAFIAVVVIATIYNRNVVMPIRQMTRQYQILQNARDDQPAQPIAIQGNDEVAELGRWFNAFLQIQDAQKKTEHALRESLNTTEILYDFNRALIGYQELPELLQMMVDHLANALKMNRIVIILLDEEDEKVTHFVVGGDGVEHVVHVAYEELMEGLTGWVLQHREPVLSMAGKPDERESEAVQERRQKTAVGDMIVVPLIYGDETMGTMTAIMPPDGRRLGQNDVDLLTTLANQATVAIANARLVESLRNSEAKFFKIFYANPEPITITSRHTDAILDANNSFLAITQYERHEIIGATAVELGLWHHPEEQMRFRQMLTEQNEVRHLEAEFCDKQGNVAITASLSATVITLDGEPCILTIAKDISEHKRLEQQRLALTMERERVQILSDFITEASHEFKTPLSIINTKAYLASKTDDAQKKDTYLQQINDQVSTISTLVDSLSLMARLDSDYKPFTQARVDVNNIMRTLHVRCQQTCNAKQITCDSDIASDALWLYADIGFLMQAIQHVIDNAIQFTPEGGHIKMHTYAEDNIIHVTISDTGIGISNEKLPRIFERFYQVDEAGTLRGFGLGLTISKAIINAFGGSISAESELGKGTTIHIRLPQA